jgi:hypothetical protein
LNQTKASAPPASARQAGASVHGVAGHEEERAGGQRGHAAGQPVDAVDQIECVGAAHEAEEREERVDRTGGQELGVEAQRAGQGGRGYLARQLQQGPQRPTVVKGTDQGDERGAGQHRPKSGGGPPTRPDRQKGRQPPGHEQGQDQGQTARAGMAARHSRPGEVRRL